MRWGGEEFVVLAPSSELHSAVALAEKLRSVIAEHSFPSGLKVTMALALQKLTRVILSKQLWLGLMQPFMNRSALVEIRFARLAR